MTSRSEVLRKLKKRWRDAEADIQAHLAMTEGKSLGNCDECHQNVGMQAGLNYAIKLLGGREIDVETR